MNTVTATYSTYFRLKNYTEYEFTKCGLCFNVKTGRKIKKVATKSGCIGYNIRGKFKSLYSLRSTLEKIPKEECPF